VPARTTRFGQEVVREGGPVKRLADPFRSTTEASDPVLKMLDELEIRVGFPRATSLRGYKPTEDEQRAIETAKGRKWHAALSQLQERPGFARMTPERKRRAVEEARERASRAVTARALALRRTGRTIAVEALAANGVQ
jgi:hypothetical protein